MKKNKSHKLTFPKITMSGLFVVALIIYVIIVGGQKTFENYRLKYSGLCIKAVVTSKNKIGSRGVIHTHYKFSVKGNDYNGYSSDDDNALIGDSIIIVYLMLNPNVSRSNSLLEVECSSCK